MALGRWGQTPGSDPNQGVSRSLTGQTPDVQTRVVPRNCRSITGKRANQQSSLRSAVGRPVRDTGPDAADRRGVPASAGDAGLGRGRPETAGPGDPPVPYLPRDEPDLHRSGHRLPGRPERGSAARPAFVPRHAARPDRGRSTDRRRQHDRARADSTSVQSPRRDARHRSRAPRRATSRDSASTSSPPTISNAKASRSPSDWPSTASARSLPAWRIGPRSSTSAIRRPPTRDVLAHERKRREAHTEEGRAGQLPVSARQGLGTSRSRAVARHGLARRSRRPRRRSR